MSDNVIRLFQIQTFNGGVYIGELVGQNSELIDNEEVLTSITCKYVMRVESLPMVTRLVSVMGFGVEKEFDFSVENIEFMSNLDDGYLVTYANALFMNRFNFHKMREPFSPEMEIRFKEEMYEELNDIVRRFGQLIDNDMLEKWVRPDLEELAGKTIH